MKVLLCILVLFSIVITYTWSGGAYERIRFLEVEDSDGERHVIQLANDTEINVVERSYDEDGDFISATTRAHIHYIDNRINHINMDIVNENYNIFPILIRFPRSEEFSIDVYKDYGDDNSKLRDARISYYDTQELYFVASYRHEPNNSVEGAIVYRNTSNKTLDRIQIQNSEGDVVQKITPQ